MIDRPPKIVPAVSARNPRADSGRLSPARSSGILTRHVAGSVLGHIASERRGTSSGDSRSTHLLVATVTRGSSRRGMCGPSRASARRVPNATGKSQSAGATACAALGKSEFTSAQLEREPQDQTKGDRRCCDIRHTRQQSVSGGERTTLEPRDPEKSTQSGP